VILCFLNETFNPNPNTAKAAVIDTIRLKLSNNLDEIVSTSKEINDIEANKYFT